MQPAVSETLTPEVSAEEVRRHLVFRHEIALLDVREEGPFAAGHPLFAANFPLSRLELDLGTRLPRKDVRIVLYDDGEALVGRAAAVLARAGYTNVAQLNGGLSAWRAAGFELFTDVNSYSKAFGELVAERKSTPSLGAEEVRKLLDADDDKVILDARRFEEYRTMNIPTGISVPGAELVLRTSQLAPDPDTLVIVNCAGRTRSIIGAQSLINAGIPNRVAALRNGTIGWLLAGQTLEHGASRSFSQASEEQIAIARDRAANVAYRAGVRTIDARDLATLSADRTRTLYRFDVRSPEEYREGHVAGFANAPGGQLVQETDIHAPARGARIVLADDLGSRALMTASWLAQMAWEAYVLNDAGSLPVITAPMEVERLPLPEVDAIDAERLSNLVRDGTVTVIDLAPSTVHARGHVPGAFFAVRARLEKDIEKLPRRECLVVTSPDGSLAAYTAADLAMLGHSGAICLAGGTSSWSAAGLPLETGFRNAISEADDVYRRPYEGVEASAAAMQAYLDWEYGLVEQLARDGTHGFFVI